MNFIKSSSDLSFNDLISDLSINNSDTIKADEDWESELTSNAGVEETEDFNSINSLDDMPFEDNSLDSFADTDFEQSASNDVDNGNLDNFSYNFATQRNRGHKEKDFTLLYKANCPCVLTENFFYDNEEDCKFMLSETGKYAIVDIHYRAILEYIAKNK